MQGRDICFENFRMYTSNFKLFELQLLSGTNKAVNIITVFFLSLTKCILFSLRGTSCVSCV